MPPNIHFIMEPMESCDSCNTSNLLFSDKSWHHLIMSGHDTCIHLMTSFGHATMYGYKFVQETISIPFHVVTCILKLHYFPFLPWIYSRKKKVFLLRVETAPALEDWTEKTERCAFIMLRFLLTSTPSYKGNAVIQIPNTEAP